MNDLIARLEKATAPTHDLDAEIYRLWRKTTPPPPNGGMWTPDSEYAPNYTGSIDDALTLVPEGYLLNLTQSRVGTWDALIHNPANADQHISFDFPYGERPKSAATAICIAALKARSVSSDNGKSET
jgi:hypothetical protein